ncbi:MAG: dienelactone hydrolase [Sphingomonas sanxanigenens]|uniref:Dienelactone hydrolase n=1 Tax=Sphingomonas sanxanigenens TaxID=397260 RepID=A0A2W5C5K7_9SPHN|nr:MAG: dienelactone hydrolase [Sphingomonas sanxanigenens]
MGVYIDYSDGDRTFQAYVARPAGGDVAPAMLVIHTVRGQTDAERERADQWAAKGCVGIAIDVYGKGRAGADPATNFTLMGECLGDRAMLSRRLLAAVAFAKGLEGVDPARIAAVGYCFGGLCALDIARSGARDVAGVVSVHGIFHPNGLPPQPIATRILICHGYSDPHAPPEAMVALAGELTDAGADWQIHAYGHVKHGFANQGYDAPERGVVYDAAADRRSRTAIDAFAAELFAGQARDAPV